MNRRNGSVPPPNGVAKSIGELMHDIASLAELQFELFRIDCREGLQRMRIPVALLLLAGIVAAGTVPVALIGLAELLVQTAGLSRPAALSIAALGGLIAAATLGVVGWSRIRGVARVLNRSREEVSNNLTWIKHALERSAPTEAPQPQDHVDAPLPANKRV